MYFQDRDRLGLSVVLASAIFALLFFLLNLVPWAGFNPFPKVSPPVIVELQAPPVPEPPPAVPRVEQAKPATLPAEPEIKPDIEIRKSETADPKQSVAPAAAKPAPAARQSGGSPPAGAPAKAAADPGPLARVNRPAVDMTDPSSWDRGRPQAPTTTANRDASVDLAVRNELEFLNKEAEKLEQWFKDNPRYGPPPKRGDETGANEVKRDPVAAVQAERLKELNARIAGLEKLLAERGPGLPGGPGGGSARGPEGPGAAGPRPQPRPTTPASGGGVNIKGSDFGGRALIEGSRPVLDAGDFDGMQPRRMELTVVFSIGESGIVEPASLQISGETRYTKVTEKIRTALARWRFSSSRGATSRGEVTFEILMNDVR